MMMAERETLGSGPYSRLVSVLFRDRKTILKEENIQNIEKADVRSSAFSLHVFSPFPLSMLCTNKEISSVYKA